MNPSSTFCRAQEMLQRGRAADALLANVRVIAEKAASAWAHEALCADKREQRQERTRLIAETLFEEKQQLNEQNDRLFSENPDRSFANT